MAVFTYSTLRAPTLDHAPWRIIYENAYLGMFGTFQYNAQHWIFKLPRWVWLPYVTMVIDEDGGRDYLSEEVKWVKFQLARRMLEILARSGWASERTLQPYLETSPF